MRIYEIISLGSVVICLMWCIIGASIMFGQLERLQDISVQYAYSRREMPIDVRQMITKTYFFSVLLCGPLIWLWWFCVGRPTARYLFLNED
jgi:hypothetical protein